ncbi:MAG: hypothetical protein WEC84_03405 [Candidatus Andersenbacteria bacterium]
MRAVFHAVTSRIGRLLTAMHYVIPSSHYALLALFFFAGLEVVLALHRWIFVVITVVLAITVLGVILIRTEEEGEFHPSQAILPTFAALGLTSFSLFVPATLWIHFYFIGSAIVFFFLLKHGAKQAYPTWNWMISLIILYVLLASILGWRFNLYVPVIFILILSSFSILLLSFQSLLRYTRRQSEAWLIALSIAFVLTEVIWVLQFLPFHFFIQTGVVTALYYVIFQLAAMSYEKKLERKDILEYIAVGTVALLMLLFTARWV